MKRYTKGIYGTELEQTNALAKRIIDSFDAERMSNMVIFCALSKVIGALIKTQCKPEYYERAINAFVESLRTLLNAEGELT